MSQTQSRTAALMGRIATFRRRGPNPVSPRRGRNGPVEDFARCIRSLAACLAQLEKIEIRLVNQHQALQSSTVPPLSPRSTRRSLHDRERLVRTARNLIKQADRLRRRRDVKMEQHYVVMEQLRLRA